MSFLLDVLSLFLLGIFIAFGKKRNIIKNDKHMLIISVSLLILFWVASSLLYMDYLNLNFLGTAGRGKWFMWNSGLELLGINLNIKPNGFLDILAIFIFVSYPIYLYAGLKSGNMFLR